MVEGDDKVRCHKQKVRSAVCFGLGLLTATVLPPKWVLVIAAAALIAVGIFCKRR